MQYAGQPIPADPPPQLGYHASPDPTNPSRWVIWSTTRFGTVRRRSGRNRLARRWYLRWYRTFQPIGGRS